LLQVTNALKTLDLEPPPTCPFILTNNEKERKRPDANPYPPLTGSTGRLIIYGSDCRPKWFSAATKRSLDATFLSVNTLIEIL
jgi:hypothetical protein